MDTVTDSSATTFQFSELLDEWHRATRAKNKFVIDPETFTKPELMAVTGEGDRLATRKIAQGLADGDIVRAMVDRDFGAWGTQAIRGYRIVAPAAE